MKLNCLPHATQPLPPFADRPQNLAGDDERKYALRLCEQADQALGIACLLIDCSDETKQPIKRATGSAVRSALWAASLGLRSIADTHLGGQRNV